MHWKLFRKRRSAGLDIGASSVKVVELAGKSTDLSLTALAAQTLAPDAVVDGQVFDREETSKAIRKLFRDHRLRVGSLTAGVGSYQVISKIIEVPLMDERELSESIEWHAEEHIPWDISDVQLDYQLLGSTDYSLQVLIVACRREVVGNLKQVIKQAGQRAAIIDADAFALQNCYTFNYQPADNSLVALVHVGASRMIINIVRGRRCVFTREITVGGNYYTDQIRREMGLTFEQAEAAKLGRNPGLEIKGADIDDAIAGLSKMLTVEEQFESLLTTVLDMFELEIRRTLEFYRATSPDEDTAIRKIMISGGGSNLKGLRKFLAERLEVTVEPLNPFLRIKCDARRFRPEFLEETGPEMAIAVGLALRGFDAPLVAINLAESSTEHERTDEPKDIQRPQRVFKFKGRNHLNDVVTGERVADSRVALQSILRREQIVLTAVIGESRLSPLLSFWRGRKKKGAKISDYDLARFTRQFAILTDVGSPLVQSFELLAPNQKNKHFQRALDEVSQDVEQGSTLTQAMARHGEFFDEFYVNLIEAGETGGILDIILQRIAHELERRIKLRRKIRLAIQYPLGVLAVGLVVLLPSIIRNLPGGTNVSTRFSAGTVAAGIWAFLTSVVGVLTLLALIATSLALYAYFKTDRGRWQGDSLLLRLPFLGKGFHDYAIARFARLLSTLLSSGVPYIASLGITEKNMGNVVFRKAIRQLSSGVERGESFSDAMTEVFPQSVKVMIGIGEQMGCLDSMLGKVADLYEQEVDVTVSRLPLLTLVVAFILLLVLAIGVSLLVVS
jgi:type IV pilus assembly protein PilM